MILFDKNPWLGGKAAQLQQDGFRFDMGPTILTVPHVLERVFQEAGRSMHDYLDLRRLDPQWRCFFDDGSVLDLQQDVPAMAATVAGFAPGSEQGYRDFIAMSAKLHEVSEKFFFWKSVEGISDTLSMKGMNLATLKDVLSLRMGTSVASQIRKRVPDGRVAQMLDHFVQYVGSSPYASPAVLCSIGHMQTELGVWYPMGGTRAVPVALEKLAGELGVDLRPGTDVTQITVQDGRANGGGDGDGRGDSALRRRVEHGQRADDAGAGAGRARRTVRAALEAGPGLLGRGAVPGGLTAHTNTWRITTSSSRRTRRRSSAGSTTRASRRRTRHATWRRPPGRKPGVAPPGGEALYVLVHTPFLRPHHDWEAMFPAYRQVILDKLKRCAGMPDLEERIVFERHLTPQDIHNRYRVLNGAIYGLASHGKVNGAFKPGNRSRDLQGLYLAGGAAHPGPGMPMVLMSGWIAADSLCQDMQPATELAATPAHG